MVGATRTTVCQTVRTSDVVQGDGVSEPTGTPLNDAGHLTACSWFRFAQEEQGVPAGAFMIVRRRFVTAPEFFNAQMGSDLYGFDTYSLAHFRIIPSGLPGHAFSRSPPRGLNMSLSPVAATPLALHCFYDRHGL